MPFGIITEIGISSLPKSPVLALTSQSSRLRHNLAAQVSDGNQGPACWAHYKTAVPHYQSDRKKETGPLVDTGLDHSVLWRSSREDAPSSSRSPRVSASPSACNSHLLLLCCYVAFFLLCFFLFCFHQSSLVFFFLPVPGNPVI